MTDRPTLVIGAAGFIGRALVHRLRTEGATISTVERGGTLPAQAGNVFYCAGVTADFRHRPYDTLAAHVTVVNTLLRDVDFASLTYLSSTRVYQKVNCGNEETPLVVDPNDPSDLYNLSKLTGEVACLTDRRSTARVIRLSNVFGKGGDSENFLDALLEQAKREKRVHIRSGAGASKDYIAINDVVEALIRVPSCAQSRLINVASGFSISNATVGRVIGEVLGVDISFNVVESGTAFPDIDIRRMRTELGIRPQAFEAAFRTWITSTE